LVILVGVFVAFAPYELLFGSAATPTPAATATPTATPTFPSFLPTANLTTPTPAEPTPTNTRLPTSTPLVPATPTATVPFSLPTLAFRPTATPTPIPPTVAVTPSPTPTLIPARQYTVFFEAEETTLEEGDCTHLEWRVEGQVTVQLNGEKVDASDSREICPSRNTDYTLTTQVAGSAEIQRRVVRITVED